MTKDEAIEKLEQLWNEVYNEDSDGYDYAKAIDIAIDTLKIKHGEWQSTDPRCPICGEDKFKGLDADIWSDWKPDYCPNCGAKMDGEK